MTRFVLDASVALAWFLDDPVPTDAIRVKQALLQGAKALVPALWSLEMANGLIVAERRKLLGTAEILRAVSYLEQMMTHAFEVHADPILLRDALTTARNFTLSAYDSVYLDLSRAEGVALATLDKSLRSAASRAGVELFR